MNISNLSIKPQLDVEGDSIYRSLYFNSANRDFGTNNAPEFIIDPEINQTERLKLMSVNIPVSFYAFPNVNLRVNENSTGSLYSNITLNGNYTNSQLTSYISSALTTASASTGSALTYNCAYDSITGKLTLTSTGGSFVITSGSANTNLGFSNVSSNVLSNSRTSDNVISLTKDAIVIESDELSRTIATSSRSIYNGDSNDPIIAVVPITSATWSYNYWEHPTGAQFLKSNNANLDRVSFRLKYLDGTNVDLNGVPWSVKIGVYTESFQ